MANLKWSCLYDLTANELALLVNFLKSDRDNLNKLVEACAWIVGPSQPSDSIIPSDQIIDDFDSLDDLFNNPALLAQIDQYF